MLVKGFDVDTINLYEAKTNLSSLVERAAAGEEIVIAKAGRPLARLVPLAKRTKPRELGLLGGQVWIADNFDDPLPDDLLRAFEGPGP
jgi:prevent-host-death family protein